MFVCFGIFPGIDSLSNGSYKNYQKYDMIVLVLLLLRFIYN